MTAPARWSVGIVVPARNESDLIDLCVTSLLTAIRGVGDDVDAWIVVVADGCHDDTATIATRRLEGRGEICVTDGRAVGAARRAGAEAVLEHFTRVGTPLMSIWLMSTDADTTVPADWIAAHLRAASAGARGVAGTVTVASFDEHPPHVADLYRRQYTVRADGRHAHLHGANLGVRADAYLEAGGWRPLATAEDRDLWDRLRRTGHPLISSIEVAVTTSGRRTGRAPDGFADFLHRLGGSTDIPRTS